MNSSKPPQSLTKVSGGVDGAFVTAGAVELLLGEVDEGADDSSGASDLDGVLDLGALLLASHEVAGDVLAVPAVLVTEQAIHRVSLFEVLPTFVDSPQVAPNGRHGGD